jgi:Iron-containing redox enzyme
LTSAGSGESEIATTLAAGESPSRRLRRKIALATGPFAAACTSLVTHPQLKQLWPEYLVVQHQIIRGTVPLTKVASQRAQTLVDRDPVASGLAVYLDEHVDEERGHDDDLLGDLEALGISADLVLGRIPSPAVASLVGAQYYWILHHHPIAFLGFVALMEGFPPTPELVETLMARSGHPAEGFRTFAEHGELDPGHRDHLDRTLDQLPLTPTQEAVMGVSATATAGLAAVVVEEVLSRT